MPDSAKLLNSIRVWLVVVIFGLVVSGITAFPLEHELHLLVRIAAHLNFSQEAPSLNLWLARVDAAITDTNTHCPFLAYGTDWLAFAHLVIAAAFIVLGETPSATNGSSTGVLSPAPVFLLSPLSLGQSAVSLSIGAVSIVPSVSSAVSLCSSSVAKSLACSRSPAHSSNFATTLDTILSCPLSPHGSSATPSPPSRSSSAPPPSPFGRRPRCRPLGPRLPARQQLPLRLRAAPQRPTPLPRPPLRTPATHLPHSGRLHSSNSSAASTGTLSPIRRPRQRSRHAPHLRIALRLLPNRWLLATFLCTPLFLSASTASTRTPSTTLTASSPSSLPSTL